MKREDLETLIELLQQFVCAHQGLGFERNAKYPGIGENIRMQLESLSRRRA